MMTVEPFLKLNNDRTAVLRIGAHNTAGPLYMPEVKGPEDLHVILDHQTVLDPNAPLIVPASRFRSLITAPQMRPREAELRMLLATRPLLMYEPPEFTHYTHGKTFLAYVHGGNRTRSKAFNAAIRGGDIERALSIMPAFYRPFAERQISALFKQLTGEPLARREADKYPHGPVSDAWRDPRVDQAFTDHFFGLIQEASRFPNAYVIPNVPMVQKSSEGTVLERLIGANIAMARLAEMNGKDKRNPVLSYFHIYADASIFDPMSERPGEILTRTAGALKLNTYAGVCCTLIDYEKAWNDGLAERVERFVGDLGNLCEENRIPLVLPRSDWFGLALADVGAHAFGSLLNGQPRYSTGGGDISLEDKYGRTPIIEYAYDAPISHVATILKEYGTLPHVEGVPDVPAAYNSAGRSVTDIFGEPESYRLRFGKPRRMTHAEESRRVRQAMQRGQQRPALRYLERSRHPQLRTGR